MKISLNSCHSDDERREALFSGDLLLFTDRPALAALCEHARGHIDAAFGLEPETAQFRMEVADFVAKAGPLKSRFTNDRATKELVRGVLTEFDCDLDETYFDVPRLRVVTTDGYLTAGVGYAYKAHRDTWYSSPACQVNWWSPVFALSEERSLAFYPRVWDRQVANSSADFDYDEWLRVGRTQAASQVKADTRNHPLPKELLDPADELRITIGAAEMVLFSGAHLHATVANTSGRTRFSFDFRTVNELDLKRGAGAPNVDSRARGTTLCDFIRASDFAPIPAYLIADPGAEGGMIEAIETSPTMHDPRTQSAADYTFREMLERYYAESPGSNTEKLENFSKYVPRQNLARFLARYEIFRRIQDVQGSIVECGVLFGGGLMAFAQLSAILEPYNFQRRIIGFDSFEGFPEIAEQDVQGLPERKSAHLKPGGFAAPCAYEDLMQAIAVFDRNRFLNHFPKVQVVKGDFVRTSAQFLADHPHLVVSCLYLDFDIYAPTRLALEKFYPRIPKGGVVVFDELNEEAFPGETAAVMEMLDLNSLRVRRFEFEPRISYAVVGE